MQKDPIEEWLHGATSAVVPSMKFLMKEASVEKVYWYMLECLVPKMGSTP